MKKFIFNKEKRTIYLAQKGFYNRKCDEDFLKKQFRNVFRYDLNLDNPKTFNEKLQWLKLYDRNPEYTKLVDKHEVKDIVAGIIGKEYIIPTIGVWDKFEEIRFDELPQQFVLKCTHDSGGLVICKDKNEIDIKKANKKIEHSLKNNYYMQNREWPYKNIKPRIIAEEYMVDESGYELKDYKFMCFNGEVKCIFVCSEREEADGVKVTFFDNDWNLLNFTRKYEMSKKNISKPISLRKMIELAEKLSEGIPFVRVDFYEIDKKPYFGEMTFFPGSGFEKFSPEIWDKKLGSWMDIPYKK